MADYKKQHFIPKFYLRGFSNNNDGTSIGIYHKQKKLFIPCSGLNNQGYEDYLYGKDGYFEKALSLIEVDSAPIIDKIKTDEILPYIQSNEYKSLLSFVILMGARNPNTAKEAVQSQEKLFRKLEELSPGSSEELPTMTQEQAIEMVFRNVTTVYQVSTDLKCKLLINHTKYPFITSDNPLTEYNQFMEPKKLSTSTTGYACMGFQLFLPIDHQKMLVYYDDLVYKVGDKKKSIVEITDDDTIHNLNVLQILNSDEMIYFNERATEGYLLTLMQRSQKYSKPNIPIVDIVPMRFKGKDNDLTNDVLHMRKSDLQIKLEVQGITFTKRAKNHVLTNSAVHLRPKAQIFIDEYTRQNPPLSYKFKNRSA
jgi:Protein of unknown function (DUF4238)